MTMMENYDESVEINHNPNWFYLLDNPYRILIVGSLRSGKTNLLLNLVKNKRPNIDNIYLCVKGQFKLSYQLLINGKKM